MPRVTELKSEEAVVSSPLRRSCRIVAVNSPHPVKGRRLSATAENNVADEKNETKPTRSKRAASVTKEDTEPKIEPAKPRTRRSSATAEPAVAEEEKREPVTRSRRSSAAEEPSQETPKPVKTRRSSITDDAAKTPAGGKSTEGDGKSKPATRRRSISKELSNEAEESKPATRSRRKSIDKDVDVEILEKKPTRQRRPSTEKLEEPETKVAKLAPIKNKRRPSVTDNAVVLEPIAEVETERKSLSPTPVVDATSKTNAALVQKKHEPSKADLDLSIINECSFTEGNSSHTEEAISNSEISTGPLKESETEREDEIEVNSAVSVDSTTPEEAKNVEEKSTTTPKKSPRFRTSTNSETSTDDIGTKALNNTEDPKLSPGLQDVTKETSCETILNKSQTGKKLTPEMSTPAESNTDDPKLPSELQDDVKKEISGEAILDKSQTSKKPTPEKMSTPAMDIDSPKSFEKPKQISPETTSSPRKSPRILARKESSIDQSEKELRTLDSNSTKETKTSTEKIQSPAALDEEKPNSLDQNIVHAKDSDLKGLPQEDLNVEDDSAFLPQASGSKEIQIKGSGTHVSTGSEDSFRFHLSNSRLDSTPEETEEDDVLNVSKISNSSDKENIAVDIDDSIKSKAPISVDKRVLGDLSVLNEKLIDLKQATTVGRVSNVFRPKNLEFSFVEPMDVDKTSVDLESTTSEKFDRTKLLSGATDDSIDESFRLNLSMTPVESTSTVFDTPTKVIESPKKVIDTPKKDIEIPKKVIETPKNVIEINKDMVDVSSEKVISKSKTVESDELIVDDSEASCATPALESEDVSNMSITKEPILEMKELIVDGSKASCATPADVCNEYISKEPVVEMKELNMDDSKASCVTPTVESEDVSNISVSKEPLVEMKEPIMDVPEASCATPAVESEDVSNISVSKEPLVEMKEPIMDVSEASCATPAVESEDVSNASISKEPLVETKEESIAQVVLDTTNNSNMSTILEEADNKPEEQNASKIVEEQSGGEKTIMSPDYDFELPSDESDSEVDNKFVERPSSSGKNESKASNVEKENKDLVEADKKLEPSDKELSCKLPVEQLEQSPTTIKLIESEEINDAEKEKAEMDESSKTPNQASSEIENKEIIVETSESEMVVNQEPVGTSEKSLSLEKSISEEKDKDIEQNHEKSNVMDGIEIDCAEGEIESTPEEDKSAMNNSSVEKKGIDDNPNIVLGNQSVNENQIKTDSEGINNDKKFQIDGEDKKTTDEKEEAPESKSDDLKDSVTSDGNSPPEMINMKTSTEVQTGQSPESVKVPSDIELIKTSDELMSTEVPTEKNDESSLRSVDTIVDNIVDAESESPTNKDYDYEEMERSFQDIIKDDETKFDSPILQPMSERKKSKKARKSKGKGLDDVKSDIIEKLVEQQAVETDSLRNMKKGNDILDNSQLSSSKTPKKAKKNAKTADEAVADIDTEDVASDLGETDTNIDTKSTEDGFSRTSKKTKKRASVLTSTADSTETVPGEGPTSDEVESSGNLSRKKKKTKRTKMSGNDEQDKNEVPKTDNKKNKKSKIKNSEDTNKTTHEKHPLEGFCHPKLDEIIDKMVLETKKKIEHVTEEEDSTENEYASEEEEEETRAENPFLDTMAEEGEEDTPSEGSNDIIDDGESINSTETEHDSDDDYDDDDSFICDEEVIELLPGDDDDHLEEEKSKTRRKSRIINVEEYDTAVIKIERKEGPVSPQRRSRIISVSSSSGDENDESTKEVVQVLEHEPSVASKDEDSNEKPKKRTSSITIIENINVNDIKDTVLSQRIHHLVDSFCTTIPRQGDISMNLSLEYADKEEEPSTKPNKQISPRSSLLQASLKETKTKKPKDVKKRGSSGDECVVPTKKPKLSDGLNDFEDLQEAQGKSNKRKRLSKSLEDINIKKNKKKKKSAKKTREVEEDSEVSDKERRYSEDDLRSKTFSLLNQLITDVKNRPRRAVKFSTSKVGSSIDDSWDVEVATVAPSTSTVSKKEIEKFKSKKLHPKDFRNQMLYGSDRVKRIETRTLLKKKGAYS